LKKSIPSDVTLPSLDANLTLPNISKKHDLHTVIRMLYSCLVDADRLDTERFMLPEQYKQRGRKSSMSDLLSLLNKHLQYLKSISSDTEVNNIRNEVQQYCIKESENNIDFYSLTVSLSEATNRLTLCMFAGRGRSPAQ
jgi:CRISPR-associated endonuclease/helicase Cas3